MSARRFSALMGSAKLAISKPSRRRANTKPKRTPTTIRSSSKKAVPCHPAGQVILGTESSSTPSQSRAETERELQASLHKPLPNVPFSSPQVFFDFYRGVADRLEANTYDAPLYRQLLKDALVPALRDASAKSLFTAQRIAKDQRDSLRLIERWCHFLCRVFHQLRTLSRKSAWLAPEVFLLIVNYYCANSPPYWTVCFGTPCNGVPFARSPTSL